MRDDSKANELVVGNATGTARCNDARTRGIKIASKASRKPSKRCSGRAEKALTRQIMCFLGPLEITGLGVLTCSEINLVISRGQWVVSAARVNEGGMRRLARPKTTSSSAGKN